MFRLNSVCLLQHYQGCAVLLSNSSNWPTSSCSEKVAVENKMAHRETVTYKCSSPTNSIIWGVLLVTTIILLNLIKGTRTKAVPEAPLNHTENTQTSSSDASEEMPSTLATKKVRAPIRQGSRFHAYRRLFQLQLLLSLTWQCTNVWGCDDGIWKGAIMYLLFMIGGCAVVCPHDRLLN